MPGCQQAFWLAARQLETPLVSILLVPEKWIRTLVNGDHRLIWIQWKLLNDALFIENLKWKIGVFNSLGLITGLNKANFSHFAWKGIFGNGDGCRVNILHVVSHSRQRFYITTNSNGDQPVQWVQRCYMAITLWVGFSLSNLTESPLYWHLVHYGLYLVVIWWF